MGRRVNSTRRPPEGRGGSLDEDIEDIWGTAPWESSNGQMAQRNNGTTGNGRNRRGIDPPNWPRLWSFLRSFFQSFGGSLVVLPLVILLKFCWLFVVIIQPSNFVKRWTILSHTHLATTQTVRDPAKCCEGGVSASKFPRMCMMDVAKTFQEQFSTQPLWWQAAVWNKSTECAAVMDKAPIGLEGPIDANVQLTWEEGSWNWIGADTSARAHILANILDLVWKDLNLSTTRSDDQVFRMFLFCTFKLLRHVSQTSTQMNQRAKGLQENRSSCAECIEHVQEESQTYRTAANSHLGVLTLLPVWIRS